MAKYDKEMFDALEFNDTYVYVPLPRKVTNIIKQRYKKNGHWYTLVSFIKKHDGEETMILGYFYVEYKTAARGPSVAHTYKIDGVVCNSNHGWDTMAETILDMYPYVGVKHRNCTQ